MHALCCCAVNSCDVHAEHQSADLGSNSPTACENSFFLSDKLQLIAMFCLRMGDTVTVHLPIASDGTSVAFSHMIYDNEMIKHVVDVEYVIVHFSV